MLCEQSDSRRMVANMIPVKDILSCKVDIPLDAIGHQVSSTMPPRIPSTEALPSLPPPSRAPPSPPSSALVPPLPSLASLPSSSSLPSPTMSPRLQPLPSVRAGEYTSLRVEEPQANVQLQLDIKDDIYKRTFVNSGIETW